MTTPQPAALPELPEPDRTMWQHGKQIDHYTADQMDARYLRGYNDALAALQSQPAAAGVSDDDLQAIDDTHNWQTLKGRMAAYRAILALRPQAVPMTDEQRQRVFAAAEHRTLAFDNVSWRDAIVDEVEAHHGITAPAGQPKE